MISIVLLFVFWYCHKRGKETRLERERTVDSNGRIIELDEDPMLEVSQPLSSTSHETPIQDLTNPSQAHPDQHPTVPHPIRTAPRPAEKANDNIVAAIAITIAISKFQTTDMSREASMSDARIVSMDIVLALAMSSVVVGLRLLLGRIRRRDRLVRDRGVRGMVVRGGGVVRMEGGRGIGVIGRGKEKEKG